MSNKFQLSASLVKQKYAFILLEHSLHLKSICQICRGICIISRHENHIAMSGLYKSRMAWDGPNEKLCYYGNCYILNAPTGIIIYADHYEIPGYYLIVWWSALIWIIYMYLRYYNIISGFTFQICTCRYLAWISLDRNLILVTKP